MSEQERRLLSGDEAVALAALDGAVVLGTGYPGTPSTEILEEFDRLGGQARWSPNEKVALEVGLGVAFGKGRALVTMKHVGLNVAADVLFTAAYSGVSGALVIVSADDPGMSSSQNEQDNRRYAVAAAVPMLEPADSQEAYDFTRLALDVSERWGVPVLLRMTTRVCHSKSVVRRGGQRQEARPAGFERDIKSRVMMPAHARPAHRRLRQKLAEIAAWNEAEGPNTILDGGADLGLIASGVATMHAREAVPEARLLKLGMTHPLPLETIRRFAEGVERCLVIEEGDPVLVESIRSAGIVVEGKAEPYRFGELDVDRVRRIVAGDESPEPAPPRGKPPELCQGCYYRTVFEILRKLDCIVSGDIGCYTLGALPPFEAMDMQTCMGASLGVGLGLRHVLPEAQARRVVSVIGDSTFVHSGITGLVEMVYNPPAGGHVVVVLDNSTTAMTGQQEHPATGRTLNHEPTARLSIEGLARAVGVSHVDVIDVQSDPQGFEGLLRSRLDSGELAMIIARRPCLLATGKIRLYEAAAAAAAAGCETALSAAAD